MNLTIKESYNRPFEFIPQTVLWTIKHRDSETKNDNLVGINASIILNLTSLIESFNKELMISWIKIICQNQKQNLKLKMMICQIGIFQWVNSY